MSVPQPQSMADWLTSFLDSFSGVEISKETIDALATALAIQQAQTAWAQTEQAMRRIGLDEQQIELEKAQFDFQINEMLPFQREQLEHQRSQMETERQLSQDRVLQSAIADSSSRFGEAAARTKVAQSVGANQYFHATPFRVNSRSGLRF